MKDEDDFRIIEEHDAQAQQPSPSSPEQKTTPPVETEGEGISFDADKAAKQKSPTPGNIQNKTPHPPFDQPVKQFPQEQPPAGEADTTNKKPPKPGNTPAEQPQQSSKTPPSDNTPPSSSKRFSKAIFPKDEEEHISPEGVVLRDRDDKKERTPSFEQTRKDFSRSDILLEEKPVTPVRDPLFAAHVLSEQGRDKEQEQQPTAPERPIPVPGMQKKKEEGRKPPSGPQQSSIVRTYESDIAQALKKGQTSLSKMVMAEEEKRKEKTTQQSKERVRTIGFLGGTALLLVAAGGVIGGALFYQNITQSPPPQQSPETTPALFLVEDTVTLRVGEGDLLSSIQNTFANLTGDLDSITRLHITEERAVGEEGAIQQVPLTAEEFLVASAVGAPESLQRSLLDEFMLGAYLFDGTQPFLVLKTDSFENAFSGMLEWEEDGLAEDVAALFGLNAEELSDTSFSDYVLKNRDLRALRSQDGALLLFYTFINPTTLVITTRESTLDEVARRIYRNQ